jgi:hypothetical protein
VSGWGLLPFSACARIEHRGCFHAHERAPVSMAGQPFHMPAPRARQRCFPCETDDVHRLPPGQSGRFHRLRLLWPPRPPCASIGDRTKPASASGIGKIVRCPRSTSRPNRSGTTSASTGFGSTVSTQPGKSSSGDGCERRRCSSFSKGWLLLPHWHGILRDSPALGARVDRLRVRGQAHAAGPCEAYVKRNKNDAADAEAICEALTRPSMRFVPTKERCTKRVSRINYGSMRHWAQKLRRTTRDRR